mmetsp:Transcript_78043/g.180992  ORF Transcript_78043/g.180992 Transcript_78043/m.180992 type:complete len:476 (-) Transcript_78043:106-1533(-)
MGGKAANLDAEAIPLTSGLDSTTPVQRKVLVRGRRRTAVIALASAFLVAGTAAWLSQQPSNATRTEGQSDLLQQKFAGSAKQCSHDCTKQYEKCSKRVPHFLSDPTGALSAKAKCVQRTTHCTFLCVKESAEDLTESAQGATQDLTESAQDTADDLTESAHGITKSAKESTKALVAAACKAVVPRVESASAYAPDSMEKSMAKIASHAYRYGLFGVFTEHDLNISWRRLQRQTLTSGLTGMGRDTVELFQNGSECALAFSGSDDLADFEEDVNGFSTENMCGAALHKGFLDKLLATVNSTLFRDKFVPLLTGSECSAGIYTTGHSLGGALATLFAGCAMKKDAPESLRGIKVEGLYTFGAPGVSKPTGLPGDSRSGQLGPSDTACFKGKRFWNTALIHGVGAADPVPGVAAVLQFVHPLVDSVDLNAIPFGKVQKTEYGCASEEARLEPRLTPTIAPDFVQHPFCLYANRIKALY